MIFCDPLGSALGLFSLCNVSGRLLRFAKIDRMSNGMIGIAERSTARLIVVSCVLNEY